MIVLAFVALVVALILLLFACDLGLIPDPGRWLDAWRGWRTERRATAPLRRRIRAGRCR